MHYLSENFVTHGSKDKTNDSGNIKKENTIKTNNTSSGCNINNSILKLCNKVKAEFQN